LVYYWKQVPVDEWRQRLQEADTRTGSRFSIVYRFYSTYDGPVRYVGRSDNLLERVAQHWSMIEDYGIHALGGRVSWVDFTYLVGRARSWVQIPPAPLLLWGRYLYTHDRVNNSRPSMSARRHSKWGKLLLDPDVERWYRSTARGNPLTA